MSRDAYGPLRKGMALQCYWPFPQDSPRMKRVHSHCLSDEELRAELEAKDSILFEGNGLSWEEILNQVVRLGFGDRYVVSVRLRDAAARINLRPK